MLLQGVLQRAMRIAVFEEQPELAAQRLLEDDVAEGDVQLVHLLGGQPRADRRRDDRSGGGAGGELEDLADGLAQVLFQVVNARVMTTPRMPPPSIAIATFLRNGFMACLSFPDQREAEMDGETGSGHRLDSETR